MTWVVLFLVAAAVGGFLAWASLRQHRHAGDATLDQMWTEVRRHQPPSNETAASSETPCCLSVAG